MLFQNSQKYVLIILLIIICFFSYLSALNGDFLSDDLVHVYFMQKMDNNIEILLKNFYSNWLDVSTTSFYRPLISITLYIDHLLWNWNPFGYHLTNILFHAMNGVLIFLIAITFKINETNGESIILAFLAAALFIVYPLHPESVYWIIGRVDSQTTSFYLFSLYMFILYIKKESNSYFIISLIGFWAALSSKEPAITLPAILTLYVFYISYVVHNKSFIFSFIMSLNKIKVYWIIVILYFVLRYYSLGTLGGGYSGTNTDFFTLEYFERWIGLSYLIVPINKINLEHMNILSFYTQFIFIFLWTVIAILLIIRKYNRQYFFLIVFFLSSFIITLIPIATVFYVFDDLEASRFLYLPSAIFFTFIAILVQDKYFNKHKIYFYGFNIFLILLILISSFQLKNNLIPWQKSSLEMNIFKKEVKQIISEREKKGEDKKAIVLTGIPDSINGAQFLRNGYGGLFSDALMDKKINNIMPILDNDFYGVKSVEIKNMMREEKKSNLYGIYRYQIGKGFSKIREENFQIRPTILNEVSSIYQDSHHLENKVNKYYVLGQEPWIKYKLITNDEKEQSNISSKIFYFKYIIDYDNIKDISDTLKIYWSTEIDNFLELDGMESKLSNCQKNKCEYIFPVATSENWDFKKDYNYIMIAIPKNSKNGMKINQLEIKTIDLLNEYEFKKNDLESLRLNSLKKIRYNSLSEILEISSFDSDYLIFPKLQINPIITDYIKIDMKINSKLNNNFGIAKLYWTSMLETEKSEQKSIKFNVIDDGNFHSYIIPLKHLPMWWTLGSIKQLFFVPFYGEAEIEIKSIVIGKKLDVPKILFSLNEKDADDLSLTVGSGTVFKRINRNEEVLLNFEIDQKQNEYFLSIQKTPPLLTNLYSDSDTQIKEVEIKTTKNIFKLQTSDLDKGMYFLRLIKKDKEINSITSDTIALLIE